MDGLLKVFRLSAWILAICFCEISHAETSADYIRTHAIIGKPGVAPQELMAAISSKRLILVGEMHGTNEMPELALQIVADLAAKVAVSVGIEFPIDIQPQVDQFMSTGDDKALRSTAFFQDVKYGSGRTSAAVISFLRDLRQLGKIAVFCFDISHQSPGTDRDTAMASHVLAYLRANPNRKILIYSGNYHSRLSDQSMGAEILRLSGGELTLSNVTNVYIRAAQGSMWACFGAADGSTDCGVHQIGPSQSAYATALSSDLYYLPEPQLADGHFNTWFIRTISASMPAR